MKSSVKKRDCRPWRLGTRADRPFKSSLAAAELASLYPLRPGGEAGGCSPAATGKGPGGVGAISGAESGREPGPRAQTRRARPGPGSNEVGRRGRGPGPGEGRRRGGDLSRVAPGAAGKSGRRVPGAPAAPAAGARPSRPQRSAAGRLTQAALCPARRSASSGCPRQPRRTCSRRPSATGPRPAPAGPPSWSTGSAPRG